MPNFAEFLYKLGNLHDCKINTFDWQPAKGIIRFDIDDLYFNYEGLPQYIGVTPGYILLNGVHFVDININEQEGVLKIQDFSVQDEGSNLLSATISFWPSGTIRVVFCDAAFPNFPLP